MVIAAALIMIVVFAGFILDDDPIIKSIGFALAVGVARRRLRRPDDARPGGDGPARPPRLVAAEWLGRILPNVDIEGEKLLKGLEQSPART